MSRGHRVVYHMLHNTAHVECYADVKYITKWAARYRVTSCIVDEPFFQALHDSSSSSSSSTISTAAPAVGIEQELPSPFLIERCVLFTRPGHISRDSCAKVTSASNGVMYTDWVQWGHSNVISPTPGLSVVDYSKMSHLAILSFYTKSSDLFILFPVLRLKDGWVFRFHISVFYARRFLSFMRRFMQCARRRIIKRRNSVVVIHIDGGGLLLFRSNASPTSLDHQINTHPDSMTMP